MSGLQLERRSLMAALYGGLVAIPFLAVRVPALYEADSGRIVAMVNHVFDHGPGFVIESQQALGPFFVYGPALVLGGLGLATWVATATLLFLSATTAYITSRLTTDWAAPIAASLALVSLDLVVSQAQTLPLYLPMLAFGYLGAWVAWTVPGDQRPWRRAALAAGLLVIAWEMQGVGQLFLASPMVYLLVERTQKRSATFRTLTSIAVFALPRIAINLADGGLSGFRRSRVDFLTVNGYLRQINTEFNFASTGGDRVAFLRDMPEAALNAVGRPGLAVLAIALIGFVGNRRARPFAVGAAALLGAALFVQMPRLIDRYWLPLFPGIAILAGLAVPTLTTKLKGRSRELGALSCLFLLAVAAGLGLTRDLRDRETRLDNASISDLQAIEALIDDDRQVFGVRSPELNRVTSEHDTVGTLFLTEEEFVTFLTWPSDEEVMKLADELNVGWFLIHENIRQEVDRHATWIVPTWERPVRHLEALRQSNEVCLRLQTGRLQRHPSLDSGQPLDGEFPTRGWALYELDPCDQ